MPPRYFDIQVNGCLGVGFTNPALSTDHIRQVVNALRARHVVSFLPTVITSEPDTLKQAFSNLHEAVATDPDLAQAIPGFHLEGPFINPADGYRGAHPAQWVRAPDVKLFEEFQECAGHRIRLVTLAPETKGALEFIRHVTARGVVVALGHTMADAATVDAAVKAGATLSTHLGNGCAAMVYRHDNPIWHQLAHDGLWASVIADGHHLPPSILNTIAKVKGPKKLILTADTGPLAGLPPGRYQDWGQELDVLPSGRIVVADTPYLAGGGHFLDDCAAHFTTITGWSTETVTQCTWENPLSLVGLLSHPLA